MRISLISTENFVISHGLRIISACMRAWLERKNPLIRQPNATRPWQHVLEPLSGYLWLGSLLYSDPQKYRGQSYNFGPSSNSSYTVTNLLELIKEYWSDIDWKGNQRKKDFEGESTLLSLNCEKALSQLSWMALLDIDETVRMTVEWYLAYNDGTDMYRFSNNQISDYLNIARNQKISWISDEE